MSLLDLMEQSAPNGSRYPSNNENRREVPVRDSVPAALPNNGGRRSIVWEDVLDVKILIEQCIKLYMSKNETVRYILDHAKIEPVATSLIWDQLKVENPDFFRAYYIRLELKRQITLFNELLERQQQAMLNLAPPSLPPMEPRPNLFQSMPVNNMAMEVPFVLPPSPIPSTVNDLPMQRLFLQQPSHPHIGQMQFYPPAYEMPAGLPTPGNYNQIPMSSGNNNGINNAVIDVPPNGTMAPNMANVYIPYPAFETAPLQTATPPFQGGSVTNIDNLVGASDSWFPSTPELDLLQLESFGDPSSYSLNWPEYPLMDQSDQSPDIQNNQNPY